MISYDIPRAVMSEEKSTEICSDFLNFKNTNSGAQLDSYYLEISLLTKKKLRLSSPNNNRKFHAM